MRKSRVWKLFVTAKTSFETEDGSSWQGSTCKDGDSHLLLKNYVKRISIWPQKYPIFNETVFGLKTLHGGRTLRRSGFLFHVIQTTRIPYPWANLFFENSDPLDWQILVYGVEINPMKTIIKTRAFEFWSSWVTALFIFHFCFQIRY